PADAALAARCGQGAAALPLLREAVARDPADLLAQATLAALGKPSLADWQSTDAPATELRLEVLALLQDPDLAAAALARAQALAAAEPGSATARLLLARALLQAGDASAAARLHGELRQTAAGPLLWREVALAQAGPAYPLEAAVEADLLGAVLEGRSGGSALTLAAGIERLAAAYERAGVPAMALDLRGRLWSLLPQATVRSAADVAAVAALPNPVEAFFVLDQVAAGLDEAGGAAARQQLAALAARLVAAGEAIGADAYAAIARQVAQGGAHGCLVHFLLDHAERFPALRPDTKAARQLLTDQLELAAAGRDPGPWFDRSIARLLAAQGAAATRGDVEAVLQRHPTCLPLWRARALVLARLQQAGRGIADLRSVLAHADAPDETLPFVLLAAAENELRPDDVRRLEALPPALLGSPDGVLARGLVALRRGAADDAVALLAKAPPRDDGLHLYALALARLQTRAVDAGLRAGEVFAQLARDYPSSSLARYAGSFASQLLPR
ncbi:MAG: hypothetical protein KF830_18950, partial [Planctomycetes bacterium]|nr:hypothetical protein [Planctomycetota bacterium]